MGDFPEVQLGADVVNRHVNRLDRVIDQARKIAHADDAATSLHGGKQRPIKRQDVIRARTARRIHEWFVAHEMINAPVTKWSIRTRGRAEREGWHPGMSTAFPIRG